MREINIVKKKSVDYASKGHFVRIFDVVEEFTDTVKELGGKTISLDGSQGQINPLQVYKTAELEEVSFTQHLSKLTIFIDSLRQRQKMMKLKNMKICFVNYIFVWDYGMTKRSEK